MFMTRVTQAKRHPKNNYPFKITILVDWQLVEKCVPFWKKQHFSIFKQMFLVALCTSLYWTMFQKADERLPWSPHHTCVYCLSPQGAWLTFEPIIFAYNPSRNDTPSSLHVSLHQEIQHIHSFKYCQRRRRCMVQTFQSSVTAHHHFPIPENN